MWFYGLVGDDQELHPWLDEAFATAGEEIVDAQLFGGAPLPNDPGAAGDTRPVDSPVTAFEHDELGYDTVVYEKGAAALLVARQQAGPARFDAALRCYAKAYAWQVATPADFAGALRGLPKAVAELRKAGAIPG
jgi:aminopeptidase N